MLFLVIYAIAAVGECIMVGKIYNSSLTQLNAEEADEVFIDGICAACVCHLILNSAEYVAFNCYSNNNTCLMFKNYSSSYTMESNTNTTFIFLSLPPPPETLTILTTTVDTEASEIISESLTITPTTTPTTTPSAASQCQLSSLPSIPVNITYDQLLLLQNMSTEFNVYECYAYGFYATSQTHTVSFGFRQDPLAWCLDDVSVVNNDTNQQLLNNSGFETGNLTGWIYSDMNSCGLGYSKVDNNVTNAHSGIYYYLSGCNGETDYLAQTFETTPGQLYVISFWLENLGGVPSLANITIS
ncbi:unnamed protein product [Didymodactylos carnosus]|uniref:Uncharacterized protein n=1 Tax=Didymodactylos carnosus TaxID=1234261 RepID=A0A814NJR0_9BILA|nr:unnamed protein product [Didymodactylos carnosus]CAF1157768.1 unnamed protein product [Didymodactylos carnosus]CAF3858293.1 unnamed protein product [Didymodactylos carnosus]CAF3969310.1 unnamed protein product [Didymodactylos carnosus]